MECQDIRELLSAYLDEVLDTIESDAVRKHLSECAGCRQELADLQKTVEIIKALGEVAPPETFRQQLQERLQRECSDTGLGKEQVEPVKGFGVSFGSRFSFLNRLAKAKYVGFAAMLVLGLGISMLADKIFTPVGMHSYGISQESTKAEVMNDAPSAIQEPEYKASNNVGITEEVSPAEAPEVAEPAVPAVPKAPAGGEAVMGARSAQDSTVAYNSKTVEEQANLRVMEDGNSLDTGSMSAASKEPNMDFSKEEARSPEVRTFGATIKEPSVGAAVSDEAPPEDQRGEGMVAMDTDDAKSKSSTPEASLKKSEPAETSTVVAEDNELSRQIIKNGWLNIEVKNFNEASKNINLTASQYGGYVENSQEHTAEQKSGSFTVRVPVRKFAEAFTQFEKMGKVTSKRLSGEDVSIEYRDANARLRNFQRQETRLLALVDKAESLGDVLALENELNRVRQQIESIEARINYLSNVTEMGTVHLEVQEVKEKYTPGPEGVFKRMWEAFKDSCGQLLHLVEGATVFLGRALPYLVVVVGAILGYRFYKNSKK